MPCAKDVCQECAVDHHPEDPHNQQSLYYQFKFHKENGRHPTWEDAMSHCSEDTQNKWKSALAEKGVGFAK